MFSLFRFSLSPPCSLSSSDLVVIRHFGAFLDHLRRRDSDTVPVLHCPLLELRVRVAAVVDKPRVVSLVLRVHNEVVVELHHEDMRVTRSPTVLQSFPRHRVVDHLANVFDNDVTGVNVLARAEPPPRRERRKHRVY